MGSKQKSVDLVYVPDSEVRHVYHLKSKVSSKEVPRNKESPSNKKEKENLTPDKDRFCDTTLDTSETPIKRRRTSTLRPRRSKIKENKNCKTSDSSISSRPKRNVQQVLHYTESTESEESSEEKTGRLKSTPAKLVLSSTARKRLIERNRGDGCIIGTPVSTRKRESRGSSNFLATTRRQLYNNTPNRVKVRRSEETPITIREKIVKKLEQSSSDEDEESSEWEESTDVSDTSEDSESEDIFISTKPKPIPSDVIKEKFHTTRRRRLDFDSGGDFTLDIDNYFQRKREPTSNNTLRKYESFEVGQNELQKILSKNYTRHKKELQTLWSFYESDFRDWMFYLKEGFSLLMYGVGSKIKIIDKFASDMLSGSYVLTVKGFYSKLLLRDVLRALIVDVFEKPTCPMSLDEAVITLKNLLKQSKFPVFLIVYNIDGLALRAPKQQMILSKLANLPNLHLIATVDHTHAPLLWGDKMLSLFNFTWIDVTTYEPYLYETWDQEVLKMNSFRDTDFNLFVKIYNGCSDKLKKIVRIIVADCFKNTRHKHDGIRLQDLYTHAKKEMLVGPGQVKSLNNLLKDFYEHGVIKKNVDDGLILNVDRHVLSIFYETECKEDD